MSGMRFRLYHLFPWLVLAAIICATLSPIQFRPRTDEPAQYERFFAYALLGLSFALAFPRFWLLILLGVPVAAFILELGQLLTPDRHWGLADVEAKMAGGVTGLALGLLLIWFAHLLHRQLGRTTPQ